MEESRHRGRTGLKRLCNACRYSVAGLAAACRHEDACRQEAPLAVILIPLALFLPTTGSGRALMIASVLLVRVVELPNSAIDAAGGRISLEDHRPAKCANDIGSAAVPLSLANVVVVRALVRTHT